MNELSEQGFYKGPKTCAVYERVASWFVNISRKSLSITPPLICFLYLLSSRPPFLGYYFSELTKILNLPTSQGTSLLPIFTISSQSRLAPSQLLKCVSFFICFLQFLLAQCQKLSFLSRVSKVRFDLKPMQESLKDIYPNLELEFP